MTSRLLLVLGVQIVGVREAHQSQPMVADADLARTVHRFMQEDVHHVPVLVKQRGQNLQHARPAFPERHVAVELLFQ
jgi:succinyl-CoA synthetase beta subunit